MLKNIILFLLPIFFISCEYLQVKSKQDEDRNIIASVGETFLYDTDIEGVVASDVSGQDSTLLVKSYINSWAKQQILLQKAKENISEVNSNEIDVLVKKYKEGLYVNGFKERLVKQQLDTVIKESEVIKYYNEHKENFKLNEELLKIKFIHLGQDFLDKKKVIKKFESKKEEDLEALENQVINFKDYILRNSKWITYNEFLEKVPPFKGEPKEKLLKVSKLIQKEDGLGVYLVAVKSVLRRNNMAPLSYIRGNIKQLILHKRKLQLIRDIEKTLINDAIEKNNFKEY